MGIECESCALNGVWSGQFRHDANDREDAAFSAWLTIADGRVTGSTLEPNTFVQGELAELEATLRGHVDGEEVVFIKTYQDLDQEPVYCEGTITEHGRKIVGQWYFSWPDELSGTFEMSRQLVRTLTHEMQAPNTRG